MSKKLNIQSEVEIRKFIENFENKTLKKLSMEILKYDSSIETLNKIQIILSNDSQFYSLKEYEQYIRDFQIDYGDVIRNFIDEDIKDTGIDSKYRALVDQAYYLEDDQLYQINDSLTEITKVDLVQIQEDILNELLFQVQENSQKD
ncbi:hypothetical protein [Mycoplasma sp. 3686d]|uniref:hypothetical protein n=1 Tax=Mycoplasma sp. 3686d TaxID=2967300 RepID=UPI00211CC031|nr:hypothetical protein [Mycoplasma sp. 3686d]UUM24535.1 hypothetical protein NPA12_02435 [Mycoplasma sp. 3686d]